jgi:hypothetical protein
VARRQKDEEATETSLEPAVARGRSSRTTSSTQRRVAAGTTRVTHLKPRPDPDGSGTPLDQLQGRVERLEAGMRMMTQTFKRAFEELNESMERLRADVALTATPADVERSVSKLATPDDVAHGAAHAVEQLRSSLQRFAQTDPTPSSAALRVALNRLAEGIEDVQSIVEGSLPEDRFERTLEPDPATNGSSSNGGPDPSTIWGEDASSAPEFGPDDPLRDHRKRGPVRRRLDHSWPGKAYANWKYRRT